MDTETKEELRHKPRLYQTELCEKAVQQNVIAYLDTGTGKTFISILVIKQLADQMVSSGKKIFFTAPKVALVNQQSKALSTWLDLRVKMVVGEMGVDAWREAEWTQLLQKHDVIVCTPMILLNALRAAFMKMEDVGLLVVDECHNARRMDPSNCTMLEFYHQLPRHLRPRVFGMTASPTVSGGKKSKTTVSEAFKQLQSNLDATIVTVLDRTELEQVAPTAQLLEVGYDGAIREGAYGVLMERLEAAVALVQVARERVQRREDLADLGVLAAQFENLRDSGLLQDIELEAPGGRSAVAHVSCWLQAVLDVCGEMGPWAGAVALAEVLGKPEDEAPDYAQWQQAAGWVDAGEVVAEAAPTEVGVLAQRVQDSKEVISLLGEQLQLQLRVCGAEFQRRWAAASSAMGQAEAVAGVEVEALAVRTALWEVYASLASVLVPDAGQRETLCAAMMALLASNMDQAEEGVLRPQVEALLAAVPVDALHYQVTEPGGSQARQWRGTLGCPVLMDKPCAAIRYLLHDYETYGPGASGAAVGSCEASVAAPNGRWSCIVFVKRKLTAVVLKRLLCALPEAKQKLPADIITGAGRGVASMTLRGQEGVLKRFSQGEVVVLVATSVAEEGLDLQSCQLVLRYHLPHSVLGFVQSRGRARMKQSRMVMLLQRGGVEEAAAVAKMKMDEQEMQRTAREKGELLLADLGEDEDEDEGGLEAAMARGGSDVEYRVASTGAVVNLAGAKQLLTMYCQKLPSDRYTILRPRFSRPRWVQEGDAECEVFLPNTAAASFAKGLPQPTFKAARASAALEAVKALHRAGGLTDRLQPAVDDVIQSAPPEVRDPQDPNRPVVLAQLLPDLLSWHGGNLTRNQPAAPPNTFTLHLYGLSLQALPPTHPSISDHKQPFIYPSPPAPSSTQPPFPSHARVTPAPPGAPDSSTVQQELVDGQWGPDLCTALTSWGLLLLQKLPDELPPFKVFPPAPEGHPATPMAAQIVYRGNLAVSGAMLRQLQEAHRVVVLRSLKRKNLASTPPSSTPFPATPFTPEEWAASAHGSWFLIAPLRSSSCSGCTAAADHTAPAATPPPNGCASHHTADASSTALDAPAAAGVQHNNPQHLPVSVLEWREVERLAEGDMPLEAAFDFSLFAHPHSQFREMAAAALQRLTVGRYVHTRYNNRRYLVTGLSSDGLTLGSAFPQDEDEEMKYSTYQEYYEVRYQQEGLEPMQPLLTAAVSGPPSLQVATMLAPPRQKPHRSEEAATEEAAEGCATDGASEGLVQAGTGPSDGEGDTEMEGGATGQGGMVSGGQGGEGTGGRPVGEAGALGGQVQDAGGSGDLQSGLLGAEPEKASKKRKFKDVTAVLLPGQVCRLEPLGGWRLRALGLLPGLMYRLQSVLLAHQARAGLLNIPGLPQPYSLTDMLHALTTTAAREPFSLERYELLGDSVLKLLTCYSLFRSHPADHEGLLTARKDTFVSNACLARVAERAGLHHYMRVYPLDVTHWQPSGMLTSSDLPQHKVNRKNLADVVEALIGMTFHTQGLPGTLALFRHLHLLPPHYLKTLEPIASLTLHLTLQHLFLPSPSTSNASPTSANNASTPATSNITTPTCPIPPTSQSHMPDNPNTPLPSAAANPIPTAAFTPPPGSTGLPARGHALPPGSTPAPSSTLDSANSSRQKAERLMRIGQALGWQFGNPELVHEAMTHCSWPYPQPPCYQRLEFLGDAVLDLLITYHLFVVHPDLPPGKLHPLKVDMVCNDRLAAIAAAWQLQKCLLHASSTLQGDVSSYLSKVSLLQEQLQQQAAEAAVTQQQEDPAAAADSSRRSQPGDLQGLRPAGVVQGAPKVMADVVEALLGAVLLDSGGDLQATAEILMSIGMLRPMGQLQQLADELPASSDTDNQSPPPSDSYYTPPPAVRQQQPGPDDLALPPSRRTVAAASGAGSSGMPLQPNALPAGCEGTPLLQEHQQLHQYHHSHQQLLKALAVTPADSCHSAVLMPGLPVGAATLHVLAVWLMICHAANVSRLMQQRWTLMQFVAGRWQCSQLVVLTFMLATIVGILERMSCLRQGGGSLADSAISGWNLNRASSTGGLLGPPALLRVGGLNGSTHRMHKTAFAGYGPASGTFRCKLTSHLSRWVSPSSRKLVRSFTAIRVRFA